MDTNHLNEQYISFDVFDTLVRRSVAQPKDIFTWMEKLHGQDMNIPRNYADIRMEAERTASDRFCKPPTLEQIYDVLSETYGDATRNWMQLELQMEYDGIRPNPEYVHLFNRCVQTGKTVVLISDMYLPSEFIGRMLKKCGVEGYQKLYVSCEAGCRKSDGALFKVVLSDLGIRPGQLMHIGDNRCSDFLVPLSLGIHVRHVKEQCKALCKKPEFISEESALTYRTIQTVAANCSERLTEYAGWGCSIFGPLLCGYAFWLAGQLKNDGIQDVYFLSRDGWMLMRAFNELQIEGIRTHYLYSSRRSYLVPTLWKHSEFSDVTNCLKRGNRMSLSLFLKKIGLEPTDYRGLADEFGLDMEYTYERGAFWKNESVIRFYEAIREDVVKQSREEYNALMAYLKSLDLPARIAVADVGYTGTAQYALQELFDTAGWNILVKGYYLGVAPAGQYVSRDLIQARGYLHGVGKNENYYEMMEPSKPLYEMQFLKPEGSLNHFVITEGRPIPVFDKFEHQEDGEDGADESSKMEEYQNGAMVFVKGFYEAFGHRLISIEPDAALWNFLRLSWHPTLHEAQTWGRFQVSDSERMYLARPKGMLYYLLHPAVLKSDFLATPWRICFMKQLFKLPLPYDRIYRFIRKRYIK